MYRRRYNTGDVTFWKSLTSYRHLYEFLSNCTIELFDFSSINALQHNYPRTYTGIDQIFSSFNNKTPPYCFNKVTFNTNPEFYEGVISEYQIELLLLHKFAQIFAEYKLLLVETQALVP